MVEKASSMKWGRKNSDDDSHRKWEDRNTAGLRAAMDKVMSMNRSRKGRFKSASMGDLAFDDSDPSDEDSLYPDFGGECFVPPPTEHARRLGMSAYQAMIDAEQDGNICIVEKSYVLTGTRLQDQSLFFCALQNLIDMERKVKPLPVIFAFSTTANSLFRMIFSSDQ